MKLAAGLLSLVIFLGSLIMLFAPGDHWPIWLALAGLALALGLTP